MITRLEFDQKTSLTEQLLRVAAAKTPGRKHQKRKGVKAKQRVKDAAKRANQMRLVGKKKFSAAVHAYWSGESDVNPASRAS